MEWNGKEEEKEELDIEGKKRNIRRTVVGNRIKKERKVDRKAERVGRIFMEVKTRKKKM